MGHYRDIINLFRASRASVTILAASVEVEEEQEPAVLSGKEDASDGKDLTNAASATYI